MFNCQMGRGRTTTGMIAASLIASIAKEDMNDPALFEDEAEEIDLNMPEEGQYLNGGLRRGALGARRRRVRHPLTRTNRRVQDDPAARDGAVARQEREASDGPRHQRHGRRAELAQGRLRLQAQGRRDRPRLGQAQPAPPPGRQLPVSLCVWAPLTPDTCSTGHPKLTPDGALIVLANFLLESKEKGVALRDTDFPSWLGAHREITNVLSRKTLA